ncbi:hypothetical protein B0H11DRAFT_1932064 [Mycena galericulata]|nr:hypothetical protein B0H11DRAFT_1932064 [Mycena galericulata]
MVFGGKLRFSAILRPKLEEDVEEDGKVDVKEDVEEDSSDQPSGGRKRKKKPPPKPKTKAAKEAGLTCFEAVKAYFEKNWFIDRWIPRFTDIGMPSDQSRDGPWNTNNWAETAFKQFNSIFLDNKHNKRRLIELNLDANAIWEADLVHSVPASETALPETFKIERIRYQQAGKACVDILAARLLKSNGPIADWLAAEAATECKKPGAVEATGRMREDDNADKELYSILNRLAKTATEKNVATTLNIKFINFVNFGDFRVLNSRGRPKAIRPMGPWRRLTRPVKEAVPGIYSHSPRFSKKRGPPKMPRLMWNSLFPANGRLLNSRRAAFMKRYHGAKAGHGESSSESGDGPELPAHRNQQPHDDDRFLNSEDLSIAASNFSHWFPSEYEMRMDEMDVFNVCLNNSDFADQAGIIFLYGSPHIPFAEKLRSLDWSQPLSIDRVCSLSSFIAATLMAATAPRKENGIFGRFTRETDQPQYQPAGFLSIGLRHWTVWHHTLNLPGGGPPYVRWFNSLPPPESDLPLIQKDIQDQRIVQQYFVRPRNSAPPPQECWDTYVPVHLGLQHDPHSCGFWSVYVAFAIILGFNPDNAAAHSLNARDIKELTGTIYSSFVGHTVGVPMDIIQNLFAKFQPTVLLSNHGPDAIMSRRPENMARAVIQDSPAQPRTPEAQSSSSGHSNTGAPDLGTNAHEADPVLFADYHELTPTGVLNPATVWVVGNAQMTPTHMKNLVNGGLVSDGIIDAFFFCYVLDILIEEGAFVEHLPFHFMAREEAVPLIDGPRAKDKTKGMPPPQPSNARRGVRKSWFPEFDVFTKERLIVPVFWKTMKHWLLAVVFFKETKVRIYDSIYQSSGTRARAVYHRLMEMLLWEHLQRFDTPLSNAWGPWLQSEVAPSVPQQNNAVDCGIFCISFGMAVAEGVNLPHADSFKYTPMDATKNRIRFANRLCIGIQADSNNHKALGLVPRSPTRPVSPALSSSSPRPVETFENEPTPEISSEVPSSTGTHEEQTLPLIDRFVLMRPAGATTGIFFPARIVSMTPSGVGLEWFCEPLLLHPALRISGEFKCSIQEWKYAANQRLSPTELAPLKWPAALAHWSREFRPFIPTSNASEGLLDHLESRIPELVSALLGDKVADHGLTLILEDARQDQAEFLRRTVTSIWRPCPRQSAILEATVGQVVSMVRYPAEPAEPTSVRELWGQAEDLASVRRLADVMIWVLGVGFLTHTDSTTVYEALRKDLIRRPQMDVEHIWRAYQSACRLNLTGGEVHPTLQIIVPGILVPDVEIVPA